MHRLPGARSIAGPPVVGPVAITRDGRPMVAYRWLGAGRGEDYVQVELDGETGDIVVHGARGDDQLSEWWPMHESRNSVMASRKEPATSAE